MHHKGRFKESERYKFPKWFEFENYRGAESFFAKEWFEQLSIRRDILFYLKPNKASITYRTVIRKDNNEDLMKKNLDDALEIIRANPLDNLEEDEVKSCPLFLIGGAYSLRGIAFDLYNPTIREYLKGVSPLSVSTLKQAMKTYKAGEQWCFNSKAENSSVFKMLEFNEKGVQHCGKNILLVAVDLSLPTSALVDEFEEFLLMERREQKKKNPRFSSKDFREWHKKAVLPYLDLLIWEAETGKSFNRIAFFCEIL